MAQPAMGYANLALLQTVAGEMDTELGEGRELHGDTNEAGVPTNSHNHQRCKRTADRRSNYEELSDRTRDYAGDCDDNDNSSAEQIRIVQRGAVSRSRCQMWNDPR